MKTNKFLIIGGVLSFIASLLHIAIIIGGPSWHRFFGAGEGMAQLVESGSIYPVIITAINALILALWGLFAFSGAEVIGRLPHLKLILGITSMIYIVRSVFGIPVVIYLDHPYLNELKRNMTFLIFSSLISLVFGMFYLIGSMQVLSNKRNQGHITKDK